MVGVKIIFTDIEIFSLTGQNMKIPRVNESIVLSRLTPMIG